MRGYTLLLLTAVVGIAFYATAPTTVAQVSVDIGVAPDCPYGYYDVRSLRLRSLRLLRFGAVPGGVFIGAGPWFHGSENFQGHVNNRCQIADHCRYRGATPQPRRETPTESIASITSPHFKGNEVRDGRGHAGGQKR